MSRLLRCAVGASVALACSPELSERAELCEDPGAAEVFSVQSLLVYRVKEEETLSQIAETFHVRGGVKRLASINHLNSPDFIRAGAGLLIPQHSPWTDSLGAYQPEAVVSPERRYCESKAWSPVEKTKVPAFARKECKAHTADCAAGPGQQVCFCEPANEGEAGVFLWLEQAGIKARWPASPSSFYNKVGDTRVFEVSQLDLDHDSRDEVVVFAFESGSNGAPIDTKRVAVLSEAHAAPLLWTDDGSFEALFVVGAEGCELQTTVWDDYSPQLEVEGLYQKREAYQYQNGTLQKSRSFPVILQRFGGARWRAWSTHPEEKGSDKVLSGVIESIEHEPALYSAYKTTFRLRLSTGEHRDFTYHGSFSDEPQQHKILSGIGDKKTMTIYPYEYWPADLSQWQGRAVEVSVLYRDESQQNFLWLK